MAGLARRLLPAALALSLFGAGCAQEPSGLRAEAQAVAESTARTAEVIAAAGLIAHLALSIDPAAPSLPEETASLLSSLAPCVSAAPVSGRVSISFGEQGQPCLLEDLALSGGIDVTGALVGDNLQLTASVDPAAPLGVGGARVLGAVFLVRPHGAGSVGSELELLVSQGGDAFLSGELSFFQDEAGDIIVDGIATLEAGEGQTSFLLSGLSFSPGSRSPRAGQVSYDDGLRAAEISFQQGAKGPELSVRLWDSRRLSFLISDLL